MSRLMFLAGLAIGAALAVAFRPRRVRTVVLLPPRVVTDLFVDAESLAAVAEAERIAGGQR